MPSGYWSKASTWVGAWPIADPTAGDTCQLRGKEFHDTPVLGGANLSIETRPAWNFGYYTRFGLLLQTLLLVGVSPFRTTNFENQPHPVCKVGIAWAISGSSVPSPELYLICSGRNASWGRVCTFREGGRYPMGGRINFMTTSRKVAAPKLKYTHLP